MKTRIWLLLLVSILILSLFATGCGTKDLVSLAGLENEDLYVGDHYGNKVKIENPEEFLEAFKAAKAAKDPKEARSEIEAEYVFYSGDSKIYYDAQGKYLIFVDKGKKTVYSVDAGIDALLEKVEQLPPVVTFGCSDDQLSELLKELSEIRESAALLFDCGDKAVLAVMAGEKPSDGYQMNLEKVSSQAGNLAIDVRLIPCKEDSDDVVTYPSAVFTLSKKTDVDVRLIIPGTSGDELLHVPVSTVEEGQNIILLWPERGSILTERVKMTGFARVPEANFIVEVEDGHNVLGIKQVTASQEAPGWGYFEFWIDLEPATSPYGTIIFATQSAKDGSTVEELMVPIGFGGK